MTAQLPYTSEICVGILDTTPPQNIKMISVGSDSELLNSTISRESCQCYSLSRDETNET